MILSFFLISLTIWIIFKLKEISKKERWKMIWWMRSSKRTRKVFQHIRKYLKNYLLYHTWTEFLLTFSSKFIFFFTNLKLLPRTIKIFEVEITVLPRIFIFSFYFLSHFIPLYFDQRGSQPNSMEKPSF